MLAKVEFLVIVFLQMGKVESDNMSIVAAMGCELDVYIDGNEVHGTLPGGKTNYKTVYQVPLPAVYSVVAIEMSPTSKAGFVMAFSSDLSLRTNGSWRCKASSAPSNWMKPTFNYWAWPYPFSGWQVVDFASANSYYLPMFKVAACPTGVCNPAASWFTSLSFQSPAAKLFCRIGPPSIVSSTPEPDPTVTIESNGVVVPFLTHTPTHYVVVALNAQVEHGVDDCYGAEVRSKIACAQLCSAGWPYCVGFQHSQTTGGARCCLIDQMSMFLAGRLSSPGWSLWKGI